MKELVRKVIYSIYLSNDKMRITFITDQEDVVYDAYGDCCSHSWFEHLEGVDALLESTVFNVEEINLDDVYPVSLHQDDNGDDIQFYGIKIITSKGVAQLEFRNASNGFYGGYLELVKENRTSTIPIDAVKVTEDF